MHLSEGLLPWSQSAGYLVAATPPLIWSFSNWRKASLSAAPGQRALWALGIVLVFAVTMIPIPIPFSPVMVHMCATPLVALLMGVGPLILPVTLILAVQALFFGHGGLSTLGANLWTLGVIGPGVSVLLFTWFKRVSVRVDIAVFIAVLGGSIAIYSADSFILSLAMAESENRQIWFNSLVATLSVVQLPLSFLEAFLSAGIVVALRRRHAEYLPVKLNSLQGRAS